MMVVKTPLQPRQNIMALPLLDLERGFILSTDSCMSCHFILDYGMHNVRLSEVSKTQ